MGIQLAGYTISCDFCNKKLDGGVLWDEMDDAIKHALKSYWILKNDGNWKCSPPYSGNCAK